MPRSAFNLILSIVLVAAIRYIAWYFFDLTIENSELLTVLGLAAASSIGFGLISESAKEWFKTRAKIFYSSDKSTKYLIIPIGLLIVPSILFGRVDLIYKSNQRLPIQMSGTFINSTSDDKTTRKTAIGFSLSKASLSIGRFAASKTYLPFVKEEIKIPYSISTETDMDFQRIERQLSYAFFSFMNQSI